MSTAVMPQNTLYEFGELLMKNGVSSATDLSAPASINHTHQLNTAVGSVRYTLSRMASTPAGANATSASQTTANIMTSILDNLHRQQQQQQQLQQLQAQQQQQQQQHRRLERTQSAPSPTGNATVATVTAILSQSAAAAAAAAAAVNTSRYKTELCRPYEEFGVCKYGDKCQFAHGMAELRNLARHPKYKTELCRTYHTAGFCPYGPRCHFVHNQEEATQHNKHVAAAMLALRNRSQHPLSAPIIAPPQLQQRHSLLPQAHISSSGSLSLDGSSSPLSNLSQSPTSSMCSFFSSEPELSSPGLEEQRLPVFNRLATTGEQHQMMLAGVVGDLRL